jgi:hypothetical protein
MGACFDFEVYRTLLAVRCRQFYSEWLGLGSSGRGYRVLGRLVWCLVSILIMTRMTLVFILISGDFLRVRCGDLSLFGDQDL